MRLGIETYVAIFLKLRDESHECAGVSRLKCCPLLEVGGQQRQGDLGRTIAQSQGIASQDLQLQKFKKGFVRSEHLLVHFNIRECQEYI